MPQDDDTPDLSPVERMQTVQAALRLFASLESALVWLGDRYLRACEEKRLTGRLAFRPGFDTRPAPPGDDRHDGSLGSDVALASEWIKTQGVSFTPLDIGRLTRPGSPRRLAGIIAAIDTPDRRRLFWDRMFRVSPHLASEIASLTKTESEFGLHRQEEQPAREGAEQQTNQQPPTLEDMMIGSTDASRIWERSPSWWRHAVGRPGSGKPIQDYGTDDAKGKRFKRADAEAYAVQHHIRKRQLTGR